LKLLRFRAAEGTFLAPAASVLEVRRSTQIQPLPGHSEGVAGLIARDGAALTVLTTLGATGGFLIVLESAEKRFALLVEEVLGVVELAESAIQPAPLGQHRGLASGAIADRGRIELIVSAEALLRSIG
jgi:chemotaxis signal transduction protein